MRRPRVHQGARTASAAARGRLRLPVVEHPLDHLPLQAVLAAAQVAGDDRIVHRLREPLAIGLGHMGERGADEQVALVVQQLRRHRRQPPAVKEVQKEGLEDVVAVMAEHHRAAPFLPRDAVEVAAPQPRTQRAIGPPLRHLVDDDGIGVRTRSGAARPSGRNSGSTVAGKPGCPWSRLQARRSTGSRPRHCSSSARPAACSCPCRPTGTPATSPAARPRRSIMPYRSIASRVSRMIRLRSLRNSVVLGRAVEERVDVVARVLFGHSSRSSIKALPCVADVA
jgi:hypothetical protein